MSEINNQRRFNPHDAIQRHAEFYLEESKKVPVDLRDLAQIDEARINLGHEPLTPDEIIRGRESSTASS